MGKRFVKAELTGEASRGVAEARQVGERSEGREQF